MCLLGFVPGDATMIECISFKLLALVRFFNRVFEGYWVPKGLNCSEHMVLRCEIALASGSNDRALI